MAVRRKSIKLYEHERALLIKLYLRVRIPTDQFDERPDDKASFAAEWRKLSGRNDEAEAIVHYMVTQRKRGLWVRLEDDYEAAPPHVELSAEEKDALVSIYYEHVTVFEKGSDNLAYDPEIGELISKEFQDATGRFVPAHQLVAKLIYYRKIGLLPRVRDVREEDLRRDREDLGWRDPGEASSE